MSPTKNLKVSLIKGGDIFIVALLCGALGGSIRWLKQEKSQEVEGFVVRHGTAVVATLPLEDSTIVVRGDVGPVTVQVEHGFARVTKSTCPHKICNHSAAIQTSGSIVCVPNRIVVEPRAKTSDVDAYVR